MSGWWAQETRHKPGLSVFRSGGAFVELYADRDGAVSAGRIMSALGHKQPLMSLAFQWLLTARSGHHGPVQSGGIFRIFLGII